MKAKTDSRSFMLTGDVSGDCLNLSLSGKIDVDAVAALWPDVQRRLERKRIQEVVLDASGIESCDGAGIALLVHIRQMAARLSLQISIQGLREDLSGLLELYPVDHLIAPLVSTKNMRGFIEEFGKSFFDAVASVCAQIAFMGELSVALVRTAVHPAGLRIKDFLLIAEKSGARALPIIGMLGFLVGLIMAFQGAVLMAQFGAEIYIADFVGKSVTRELGPLITAIIVAGRTGSAFAAELGTMKVNEEIDAFVTMGLDPVRFLVVPRVLAATIMTPLLAVFTNLFGMAGGAVVMRGIGFPLVTYVNRVADSVTSVDFVSGLVKALVFGLLISSAGCMCGLRTGEGASAVGNSATRAVVSSIVMIVIADGLFAVVFYFLGI